MKNNNDISILDELNSRLDDFFSEDLNSNYNNDEDNNNEVYSNDSTNKKDNKFSNNFSSNINKPFDALKAILLEMDWDINDENLKRYLEELDKLLFIYKDDKVTYLLLILLKSLGIYVIYKKSNANPDVLKFLYNSFNDVEKISEKFLSQYEKNILLLNEVLKFKKMKLNLYPNKNDNIILSDKNSDKKKINFKQLPEDIQNEINSYIEKEIKHKIDEIKVKLNVKII